MPEKKPVPPPAPRNRHERRKRATEERRARPWVRARPAWPRFVEASPDCVPGDFTIIKPGTIQGPDGTTWQFVEDKPIDPEGVVVVPDADGTPVLRPYQARAVREALRSGGIVCSTAGGFTRPTAPADPPPATFDAFVGSTRVETHPTCPELTALEEKAERGNMLLGMSLTEPQ